MRRNVSAAVVLTIALAPPAAAQARVERNVIYGMYSGLALLMDVYYPAKSNRIGIVFVAGRGFYAPLELTASPLKDGLINTRFGSGLAERGFTVFALNHRATPRFQYPVPVEDVQRAVRFVRLGGGIPEALLVGAGSEQWTIGISEAGPGVRLTTSAQVREANLGLAVGRLRDGSGVVPDRRNQRGPSRTSRGDLAHHFGASLWHKFLTVSTLHESYAAPCGRRPPSTLRDHRTHPAA